MKNIMWRLVNGEMPVYNMPKVLVVAAGTNDVVPPHGCSRGAAMTSAMKLEQMLLWIRSRAPLTYLIILGILPKVRLSCLLSKERTRNAVFLARNGRLYCKPASLPYGACLMHLTRQVVGSCLWGGRRISGELYGLPCRAGCRYGLPCVPDEGWWWSDAAGRPQCAKLVSHVGGCLCKALTLAEVMFR